MQDEESSGGLDLTIPSGTAWKSVTMRPGFFTLQASACLPVLVHSPTLQLAKHVLLAVSLQETFHPNLDKGLNIRVNRITRERKEDEIDDDAQRGNTLVRAEELKKLREHGDLETPCRKPHLKACHDIMSQEVS